MTTRENTPPPIAPEGKPPGSGKQKAPEQGPESATIERAETDSHEVERISQQQAQSIPADPDPDDPVSP